MPPAILSEYDRVKQQTRTPWWMFIGTALFAVLIGAALIANKQRQEHNAQWILAPKSGDIYEYKTDDGKFSLLKVNGVEGDSVFLRENLYETDKRKGLNKLKDKGDAGFSKDEYSVSKKEVKEMFDKEVILDIDRD